MSIERMKRKQAERIALFAHYGIKATNAAGVVSRITVDAKNADKILKVLIYLAHYFAAKRAARRNRKRERRLKGEKVSRGY